MFAVQLTCCGRDDGCPAFSTWQEADEFREAYLSGPDVGAPTEMRFGPGGHSRSAIIVAVVRDPDREPRYPDYAKRTRNARNREGAHEPYRTGRNREGG